MDYECEAFYAGELGKVGAIVRASSDDTLRTRTVFGAADSLYLVDQVTRHAGDVRDWTAFHFTDHGQEATVYGERVAGQIVINGRTTGLPDQAVPSYVTRQIVPQALVDPDLEFVQFHEHGTTVDATTVWLGHDQVQTPWGDRIDCRTVQLINNGTPSYVFHFADRATEGAEPPELIMSDWVGARSYPVPDLDILLDGLDDEVVLLIKDFLDQ